MATRSGLNRDESENQAPGQSVHKPENEAPDSWRKFFVLLAGRTNGVHESVVKTFESSGQTQVETSKDADYCLLFCPVSTRVGTDVGYAMELLDEHGKEAVLVVMHHTFNREQVIPPSRRLVDDRRVRLTLDCLFYQNKLLRCEFNDKMKTNIKKFFRSSILEMSQQTDPSGQTAPGQNVEAEAGRDSGQKSKGGSTSSKASHPPETSHRAYWRGIWASVKNAFTQTEKETETQESQNNVADSNPQDKSRSNPGSVPPNRNGSLDHQGAPPPQSDSGTNESSKTESNTGSGPPGGPGESGSQDHQETGPPQSEHVSDDSSNMETGSGPAEPGSGGDPGPSDQQDAPPPRPEDGTQSRASWRKFFVLTGQTHGPCCSVVKLFESLGQTEVDSPEDADYWLILCPMSAQVEKNIMEVMEHLPNGKTAVLVVMHHTSNPEAKILLSVKLVDEPRVRLTLDCLFYQDKLLKCELNDKKKADIQKFFRSSTPEVP